VVIEQIVPKLVTHGGTLQDCLGKALLVRGLRLH